MTSRHLTTFGILLSLTSNLGTSSAMIASARFVEGLDFRWCGNWHGPCNGDGIRKKVARLFGLTFVALLTIAGWNVGFDPPVCGIAILFARKLPVIHVSNFFSVIVRW